MADKRHLRILKRGVEAWNRWRNKTREIPDLRAGDLSGAKLESANLCGTNFENANLYCANLEDANLSGAHLWIADLAHANLSRTDLSGTDLRDATLRDANLCGANLSSAGLIDANLKGADLRHANLSGANLSGADLSEVDFTEANLREANLHGAGLRSANFYRANLKGANMENASASFTNFGDCDLSEVKGLDSINHLGPSTIGVDTIYRSKGIIPESFLRGCGVQQGFITEMSSLIGAVDGIQFYSCFISYSSKNDEFARRLHGRMRDAHLRVWFAPEDMRGGNLMIHQIETAIRVYDKLLIVLSEASLQSEWVMTEIRRARKAERQSGKRKLFPVRLVDFETLRDWECFDADSGKDLAVELREYFIPDFSNWKDHDQFEAAFSRLLKDLRAEERAK